VNDVTAKQVREALWHVDAEMEQGGWDQNAQLWMVVVTAGPGEDVVGFVPLFGWDQVAEQAPDMQAALRLLTTVYEGMPAELKANMLSESTMFGVAFASEAWLLRIDQENQEHVRAVADVHAIHTDPDRVEVRIIHLAPLDGPAAMLQHERDGIVQLHDEMDTNFHASGEIPRLLAKLNKALVTPPST